MAGMYGCFKGRNSERAAMESGPPDVMTSQEPAEAQEEYSGKKKSKFQTFKKFFARKKRKEPSAAGADVGLKASQSSDNVSKTSENNTLTRSEKDKGSGSKISLGSKALSHDSVFVSDSSEANEALGASQDSIHGKVKSLQLQLKQAMKLSSPPSLICMKGRDDAGAMSEDDGLPCSPPEYSTVMNQAQRNSFISVEGVDHDEEQLSCGASSRAVSPLVVPGDFSQPASPLGCLDNSAAKHKMGLRHKACNKRKPASRLEAKAEADSGDEAMNSSMTEAVVEQEQQMAEVVTFNELKSKVQMEEEEQEEEEHPQQSTLSLQRNKEGEEGERDVFHGPDTSPPELSLSEEVSDAIFSSKSSSTASSVDTPRETPEPSVGPREYLLDPPGMSYGVEENRVKSDLAMREEEDRVEKREKEESSLLQEVLSSLRSPLVSLSVGVQTEGVVLMLEEAVKEKEREEAEIEEGEEMKEEEADYNVAPCSSLIGHTKDEEEDVVSLSCQEEEVPPEETKEEEAEEEQAAVVSQHQENEEGEKEEANEVKPEEEIDLLNGQIDIQVEEEAGQESQSEGEEEAIELEKEQEVEEEGREKTEEVDEEEKVKDEKERVEEAEEATEEEKDDAEEMTERFPDAADVQTAVQLQEADDGADVAVGGDSVCATKHTDDDETPTEVGDEVFITVNECQANDNQNSGDENDDGDESEEEVVKIEQKSDQDEDMEENQEVADQTQQDLEQENVEIAPPDLKQSENYQIEAAEQVAAPSMLPDLSLPEWSHFGSIIPSKTSTTTVHINLVSPSSEKATAFFQQSPTSAQPKRSESPSNAVSAEQTASPAEVTGACAVEEVTEEEQSDLKEPPDTVEDTVSEPCVSSDQSKVRFTIAPAWQRSHSLTPPSSPPACISSLPSTVALPGSEDVEAASQRDPAVKAEPESSAKVELVLSPGRARNAGSIGAKPQGDPPLSPCSTKPQSSAGASTEAGGPLLNFPLPTKESSVIVEGNPDNPFGVRLRKTSALHRFNSEEENTESPTEPPVQPTSCKTEPLQPASVKPLISQAVSNKPALPKKPDVHGDGGGKTRRISDPAAGRGVSGGSEAPSWISVAKQKHKIYKENSLDEIAVKKEEPERKNSLPTYVSSAASREQSIKNSDSANKVSPVEICKPSVEKETRRALSPPTSVPLQPSNSPSLPCPVPPKPLVLPVSAKPPPQPSLAQRPLSPPTPVPVSQKSPACTSPPSLSKTASSTPLSKTGQPQGTTVPSPPFSLRTTQDSAGSKAPGTSGQILSSQRSTPSSALPQDEPPWMALAKKKAKAWSEMPQIVQ